jgi:hypothetical protein
MKVSMSFGVQQAVVALAAIVAITSCAPAVQKMTAEQVRSTFVGTTDYGTYQSGKTFVSYMASDGTITLRHEGQTDVGQYRIEPDGSLCVQYHAQQQDGDLCQTVWQATDRFYTSFSNGKPGATITSVKPGNAEHL